MKKIFLMAMVAMMAASCTTMKMSTAKTMDVESSLTSKTTADMIVSERKISYDYYPNKKERKAGMNQVLNNAVSAALKANGDADVLVHMQYNAIIKKKLWFSKKIRQVTVSGYPATYRYFKVQESN